MCSNFVKIKYTGNISGLEETITYLVQYMDKFQNKECNNSDQVQYQYTVYSPCVLTQACTLLVYRRRFPDMSFIMLQEGHRLKMLSEYLQLISV